MSEMQQFCINSFIMFKIVIHFYFTIFTSQINIVVDSYTA